MQLPEEVKLAWGRREGPIVFATVNTAGVPNVIYATFVKLFPDSTIAIADNFFQKTFSNINTGSRGSLLFITGEKKAYQIKGTVDYCSEGAVFQDMLSWVENRFPRKGVAVLNPLEVFRGKDRLI